MSVSKKVGSIKFGTFIGITAALMSITVLYTILLKEELTFEKLTPESAEIQWSNVETMLMVFNEFKVPLLLFDIDILPNLFVARSPAWRNSKHKCKSLCKYHPEEKNVITFAATAKSLEPKLSDIMDSLEVFHFTCHLSKVIDPRFAHLDDQPPVFTPTYLWMARQNHIIHITILHERHDYVWAGPVTDGEWFTTAKTLAQSLGEGWHSLDKVGAKFPKYAQGYDLSHRFTGLPTTLDGHHMNIPYHISQFLKEYNESKFTECNHDAARVYRTNYAMEATEDQIKFQKHARALLKKVKKVLDDLEIPFWISSGTLLGWIRECDIIPHSVDVDIGVWADDYKEGIIERMEYEGLLLKNIFGKVIDSYELSFIDENNVKIDIFFFYKKGEIAWNGGTVAHTGQKYKYLFPMFTLCWTEFVEMKVRIPCDTERYIIANYGKGWKKPVKEWQWDKSPYNVIANGYWPSSEWDKVIQVFEPAKKEDHNTETKNDL